MCAFRAPIPFFMCCNHANGLVLANDGLATWENDAVQVWHFCASPVDPEAETGGVSNVVRALALETARIGISTTVVCGAHELGKMTASPGDRGHGPNLRVVTVRADRPLELLVGIDRLIRSIPVDAAIHVHAGFSVFADFAMMRLRRHKRRYVYTPHGKLSPGMMRRRQWLKMSWLALVGRANIAGAARIVVGSEGECGLFARIGLKGPVTVISNGFERPDRPRQPDPPLIPGPYLLFLGRIEPRKQPALLLQAFAASRARHTVRLAFVGPDQDSHRQTLEALGQELGVGDRILFNGPAYRGEKWNILDNALALVLPSAGEGMPIVLVEAAGAGVPTLSSVDCNARLLVAAGASLEIVGFDLPVWTRALDQIVEDVALHEAMAAAAREVAATLTWTALTRSWMTVYEDLLEPAA